MEFEVKDMPYIVVKSRYPTDKVPEVAKRYLEVVSKYPPDKTLDEVVVPASVKATEQGIETIGISLAKEGKLEEALSRTIQRMVMYHDIEGYEYSVEIQNTIDEALTYIGMSRSK
ncbi:MAG: hypothetical protein ACFE8Z_05940 [Candidatus Hermodarchaeota archaeon]